MFPVLRGKPHQKCFIYGVSGGKFSRGVSQNHVKFRCQIRNCRLLFICLRRGLSGFLTARFLRSSIPGRIRLFSGCFRVRHTLIPRRP